MEHFSIEGITGVEGEISDATELCFDGRKSYSRREEELWWEITLRSFDREVS